MSRVGLERYKIRVWLRGGDESLERKILPVIYLLCSRWGQGLRLGREAQKAYFKV